ncbi:MAG: ABC transporter ATP-binding protein, partial [Myxococcota bacterium]
MSLEIEELVVCYGEKRAVDGVTLSLTEPGVYALLGPNGAGKTSLIRAALGLLPWAKGRVELCGGHPRNREVRERLGVMLQGCELPDALTPIELLQHHRSFFQRTESVSELVERCALQGVSSTRYRSLSGGQKRRVQLALALVGRPQLLFLDEPSPGLDPETRRLMWQEIRSRVEEGCVILLTTHDLVEADALADQVLILRDGRLVGQGSAKEVRSMVSGVRIRCRTKLARERLVILPAVERCETDGRSCELVSSNG